MSYRRFGPRKVFRRPCHNERGAAAVEFALVSPLLLALLFGVIQFGILSAQQLSLNSAVRDGARFGSVNAFSGDHTCGAVVQKVRAAAATIGMSGSAVSVRVMRSGAGAPVAVCDTNDPSSLSSAPAPCVNPSATVDSPDTLTVEARFTSHFVVPLPIGTSSKPLSGTGAFQCEYNQ